MAIVDERMKEPHVSREDFHELKEIVKVHIISATTIYLSISHWEKKMKKINETGINGKELESIFELKKRLKEEFPDVG